MSLSNAQRSKWDARYTGIGQTFFVTYLSSYSSSHPSLRSSSKIFSPSLVESPALKVDPPPTKVHFRTYIGRVRLSANAVVHPSTPKIPYYLYWEKTNFAGTIVGSIPHSARKTPPRTYKFAYLYSFRLSGLL